MGVVTPRQGSDTAETSDYCGNRSLTCLDLTLYGHRQLVYDRRTATEDRAPVGTDPSAVAGPYGTGSILRGAACCVCAGGLHAINPERSESSGLVVLA